MAGNDGVDAILCAIHKRDALSVVYIVYGKLTKLKATKRNNNEAYRDFELRFIA